MTGKGEVQLLAQTVELVECIEAQGRQQLVLRDQQLQLGDPDQDLLLNDVRLFLQHLNIPIPSTGAETTSTVISDSLKIFTTIISVI